MTQSSPNETNDQQLILFDLGSSTPSSAGPAFLPELTAPPPARKKGKQPNAPTQATKPTSSSPVPTRLEISPRPPMPEITPLLLAGVRAALFQTLAQEALATYQTLRDQHPAASHDQVVLGVEPVRLGASAQLLLDSPALNAAVSLLALGATLTPRT